MIFNMFTEVINRVSSVESDKTMTGLWEVLPPLTFKQSSRRSRFFGVTSCPFAGSHFAVASLQRHPVGDLSYLEFMGAEVPKEEGFSRQA